MPAPRSLLFALSLLPLCLAASPALAAVRLPALVGSHMVLQRERPLALWGWAAVGERVHLTFRGKTYAAAAPDAAGRWQVMLPAMPAGGPYKLTVQGRNTIVLTDILVGDVWLASGQSNMQFKVKDRPGGYQPVQNADQEIAKANWPKIRCFTVAQTIAYRPQPTVAGSGWQVCSPATVAEFSAVAYFFGRELYQKYHVPIGLLVSSWGGTPAEAWTSAEGLKTLPEFGATLTDFARRRTLLMADQQAFETSQRSFFKNIRTYDQGYLPGGQTWAAPEFDAQAWSQMTLPGLWEATPGLNTYDGIVWFRKEIDLPAAMAGQPLTLSVGKVDDVDSTFFNGVRVGSTSGYDTPRVYQIPAALVRPGRNVIAVRVLDTGGGGGIWGEAATLNLTGLGGALPLAGPWQYKVGLDPKNLPVPVFPGGGQQAPATLFNGMIAPLIPFALKGAIWYQGETNAERAEQYRTLFPAMITDWRRRWGQEFPFLFVQLANFRAARPQPAESDWAELREAQAQTLALPRTALATAIDIGDPDDIHPHNKQEVGRRLALAARRVAYGDKAVVYSGPTYAGMTPTGAAIRLKFKNTGAGLLVKNNAALQGFAIAGTDRKFYWATARLDGNDVLVESDQVKTPVAVRYDWADNPNGNLLNKEGLPALPFRTDTWPGITAGKK